MLKADLPAFARQTLKHILNKDGEMLYSSHETIKKGDVYLMGLNPGGEGLNSIASHIDKMLTKTTNSYLDEEWENGGGRWPKGQAPLQLRIQWVLGQLELVPAEVCASNLIFQTSRNADGVSFGLAGICWPVHEAIIDIVRPKLLLTFGNGAGSSPYAFLKEMFFSGDQEKDQDRIEFGHGTAQCKAFQTSINGLSLCVAGIPHMSRFNPIGKHHVVEWLRSKIINDSAGYLR